MEYVQERVTTLHDYGDAAPAAPTEEAAVVVPMTGRDAGGPAADRVLDALETVSPARVVLALRATPEDAVAAREWLDGFDVPVDLCWCNAPALESRLADAGLAGAQGKGRDVWLGLGLAARESYVAVHDADNRNYDATHVPKLLFPLSRGHRFSKAYYARVEDERLYGRLFRLFVRPLVRALGAQHDAPVLDYLESFRYALAGEFAATSDLVSRLRLQRGWGLEIGTLGDAFAGAGFERSAQVDLGIHEHDHRAVSGAGGLSTMSEEVGAALFRVCEENGLAPEYGALRERYRAAARDLISAYADDAAFNGFEYDPSDERGQVDTYASAIGPPGEDDRLPAWADVSLDPERLLADARADLERAARNELEVSERP